MKLFLSLLFLWPCFIFSQNKIKPQFSVAINDGRGKQFVVDRHVEAKGKNALGYYLGFGLTKEAGSFEYYLGMRWGSENSNFRTYINRSEQYHNVRFNNKTFTFIFAPGLAINKHNKIFLTLGLARVFKSSITGGGEANYNSGSYTYQYGVNLVPDSWVFRQGIKWQIRPLTDKKLRFELGLEIPLMYYQALIRVPDNNYFLPATAYNLSYQLNFLYFGVLF